jgi:hypothetical protein
MDDEKNKSSYVRKLRAIIKKSQESQESQRGGRASSFKEALAAVTLGFDKIHTDVYGENNRGHAVNPSGSRTSSRYKKEKSPVESGRASKKLLVGAGMSDVCSNAALVSPKKTLKRVFLPKIDHRNDGGKKPVAEGRKSNSSLKPASKRDRQKSNLHKVSNVPLTSFKT